MFMLSISLLTCGRVEVDSISVGVISTNEFTESPVPLQMDNEHCVSYLKSSR